MRVFSLIGVIFLQLLSVVALLAAGCEGSSAGSKAGDGVADGGEIAVSPDGPIALGFFEEQAFLVTLTGPDGSPLSGEPISVSLIGPAHNGFVSPFEFSSDEQGEGEVLFTAPDTATDLQIRFSSPAAAWDAVVDVTVDPSQLGFTIDVTYGGERPVESVEVALYRDATCQDLALGVAGEPVEVQAGDSLPAEFDFFGLYASSTYAVSAVGFNEDHALRAETCLDSLAPDGQGSSLALADVALDLVGVFDVATAIDTGDTLVPVVDQLATALDPFSADVPGAILDAIREVIAAEPLVAESFDAIRAGDDLDGLLADDLADRGVDVAASLAATWEDVRAGIEEMDLSAEIEISAPSDGIYDIYHTVGLLMFDDFDASFFVPVTETGQATGQLADGDVDLLLISQHQIGLGLGGPIHFLFDTELAAVYETEGLAAALEAMVVCDAVVAALAEPLSDVADSAEILAGCQGAMAGAQTLLDDQTDWVDAEYAQVTFASGSCRLEDPGEGSFVEVLTDGEFQVTWEGDVPLGPMAAQFVGEIQD